MWLGTAKTEKRVSWGNRSWGNWASQISKDVKATAEKVPGGHSDIKVLFRNNPNLFSFFASIWKKARPIQNPCMRKHDVHNHLTQMVRDPGPVQTTFSRTVITRGAHGIAVLLISSRRKNHSGGSRRISNGLSLCPGHL